MDQAEKDNLEFELSQYLDGELSGRRARRLERRLAEDPALQEELKKYAALEGHLAGMARKGPEGADYDFQRAEILRMLERKRLLEAPRRRPVVLRPWFMAAGGGLAVAATVIISVLAWMPPHVPVGSSLAPEVSVAVVAPSARQHGQVQVALPRLDAMDYRLSEVAAGTEPQESGAEPEPPPGTVLVSVNSPSPSRWDAGAFPFPVEF